LFEERAMRMSSTIAAIVLALALSAGAMSAAIAQSPGEAVAADIRKNLPDGWTCTLISETGKMGHPHGLEEPLFRLDFVNPNVAFIEETGPVHPNLRLHFHASAERERILKTIEAERAYSWAIPTLFADTRDYVVVTSPLWQNNNKVQVGNTTWGAGVYTQEANRLIAPLLQTLKQYFDSRTAVAVQSRPDFAGRWVLVREDATPDAPGAFGESFVAAQYATSLVIDWSFFAQGRGAPGKTERKTHSALIFDGTESNVSDIYSSGSHAQIVDTSVWDGQKLVITTTWRGNSPAHVSRKLTMWLDSDGTLLVESSTPSEGGGPWSTVRSRYRRMSGAERIGGQAPASRV
jgi:hypothetical protein